MVTPYHSTDQHLPGEVLQIDVEFVRMVAEKSRHQVVAITDGGKVLYRVFRGQILQDGHHVISRENRDGR